MSTQAWGHAGDTLTHFYDANGSSTNKIYADVDTGGNPADIVAASPEIRYDRSEYNYQNRLARFTEYRIVGPDAVRTITEYRYNPDGIRIASSTYKTVNGGPAQDQTATEYLVDSLNHTGYAQVLQEKTTSYTAAGAPSTQTRTDYTLGDDVISQTRSAWDWNEPAEGWSLNATFDTQYLLYDGHGSTRQLALPNQAIAESYSYDSYGVMPAGNPTASTPAATNLLYAGEQFDTSNQQYYFRARYYNPANGLFNRVDPYAGNLQDPQSLHKYAYCHNNPVNNFDPLGMWSIGEITLVQKITAVAIGALAPAIITGYESAKAGLGWGQIVANSAIAWALAFGFGVGMIFIGPAMCKAIITALTQIPGISIEMAKTALMVVGYGMLAYGMLGLWMSDYPLAVKISVTIVIAVSIIVAIYNFKQEPSGGRLGNPDVRNQNRQIAHELENRGYKITHGGGDLPEEYLPAHDGGRKGSNYIDITAKHNDTGKIVRINTVSTRADGFTPTTEEAAAAALIRSKLPPGEHLVLIPKR